MSRKIIAIIFVFLSLAAKSQTIEVLQTGKKTSLRGLSVVSNNIIWVSGSNGTVGKSLDAGKTWQWINVKGFEKRDFRDIEAWNGNAAVIMAISEPAVILKTIDGGANWKTVYENKTVGMFLDAMDFRDEKNGMVIGDPIKDKLFLAATNDGGETWHEIAEENLPKVDSGEACFASSGTNIRLWNKTENCFVTGGMRSRVFVNGVATDIPIVQGGSTHGANSIAVRYNNKQTTLPYFVIVGGDFTKDTLAEKNCVISADGGKTWKPSLSGPKGYRSCVEFINADKMICCGTSGVDISTDGGTNWKFISMQSFHACRKAKSGNAVFLSGKNGTIGKLNW